VKRSEIGGREELRNFTLEAMEVSLGKFRFGGNELEGTKVWEKSLCFHSEVMKTVRDKK